jgi:hypothetical protein
MSLLTRNRRVLAKSYQRNHHGTFKAIAHYHSDDEKSKKAKDRKDWFDLCTNRCEKIPNCKCFTYNHKTQSAYLYEYHVPSALIDKDNRDRDYKLKNGEPTKRVTWHSFVIFD